MSGDTAGAVALGGAVVEVEIRDRSFAPEIAELAVGDTVVWNNTSEEDHTVTHAAGPGVEFDSQSIPASFGTFQHEFAEAGTVEYRCEIHPDEMRASVVVSTP